MRLPIAILLSVLFAGAALAAPPDILNGSAEQGSVTVGVYHPTGSGSQDYVREFDGRILSVGSIEDLSILGYAGPWQYSTYARYLFAKDADAAFGVNYRNLFGVSVYSSELTHRLALYPLSDPALVGTPAAGGADIVSISPAQSFAIDRVVNNFNFRATPFAGQYVRFVLNSWQQSKDGTEQVIFRSREAKAGVIANGVKASVALPVDSQTNENTVGADVQVGKNSVVNYRFVDTQFNEGNTGITSGSRLDFLPLNSLTRVDSDTHSSIVKVRSTIGKNLFFTGVQTNRQRDNTRATLSNPTSTSINATNAALTYLANDSLTLTARYRRFDQDNETGPVMSGGEPTNMALSDATQSALLEATYAGIPRAFLKLGYERRDISRSTTNGDPDFPIIRLSSNSNIITGGFRYYPNTALSLTANGEFANADNAGYSGVANQRKKIDASATYMLRDDIALYANYDLLDERNDQIQVPFADIPPAATNAAQQEAREEAAGQGYRNKMQTTTLGTWYALSQKLVFDANFARIQTDAAAVWIIGIDPTALPHIAPDYVPYEANNNQWSAGLTYSFSPRWRIYGRYLLSRSDGRSVIDPAKFPGQLGPTWNPVSTRENRYTIGFACDVSIRDTLSLDYSLSDWTDAVDHANDGIFDIWRLAWSHQF